MKIVSIVGARPQFVKLAPLSRKLRENHEEIIVHTGQHFDEKMSQLLFDDLNIPEPDYNLAVNSGMHGEQTAKMLEKIEKLLIDQRPDLVIVFGDTTSTLAGALAAVKLHIRTIHVEAGLRSYNRTMPEEINRIATDHISEYLFAPTKKSFALLQGEGLADRAFLTGDIMVDALRENITRAESRVGLVDELKVKPKEYYLLTLHRPYNVDDPKKLKHIVESLSQLDKTVVFPAHPRTRKVINNNSLDIPANILITEPFGYLDFLCLENNSSKIITDSGGIQKEAYLLKVPCITLRSETEWGETVDECWNVLLSALDKNLAEKIAGFSPSSEQSGFLGSKVAEKMSEIISGL